jgi:hypothetical protein
MAESARGPGHLGDVEWFRYHTLSATSRHLAAMRAEELERYAHAVLFGTRFPALSCRIENA